MKVVLSIALVSTLLITTPTALAQTSQTPAATQTLPPLPVVTNVHVNPDNTEETYIVNHNRLVRESARDIYAMSGFDLDKWPYIEASNPPNGNIPGINFMIPDNSRWGWRFLSRQTERHVTTRAYIDVAGNADFTGTVHSQTFRAGTPGIYTDNILSWGNHLGGDFLTKMFSSATASLYGVSASVFGISYNGVSVMTQDAYGNLAIFGNAVAKRFSATAMQVNGATITADNGAPSAACAIGDIYIRKDGVAGSTLYGCAATNAWSPIGGAAGSARQAAASSTPVVPQLAQAPFSARATSSTLVTLATLPMTLGVSNGPKGNWYVCAIVEATAEGNMPNAKSGRLTYGIGTSNLGSGTSFRMYSRPQSGARNGAFPETVVSDWAVALGEAIDGVQNASSNGRYCNSYSNDSTLSFTGYAVASKGVGPNPVYTSGQIEIQATPQ